MSAVAETLPALRVSIARIESGQARTSRDGMVSLGHAAADACLGGGLRRGAVHEVFASEARDAAAASGFAAALAVLLAQTRMICWIREDLAALEAGEPFATGLVEVGLDPRRLIMVQAADAACVLRAGWEAAQCYALGALILEPWGEPKTLDLVASRRLSLAAANSGVTVILLRTAARPMPSAAATRWIISPGPSGSEEWGAPVFATDLQRNRSGQTGGWIMEWQCDGLKFREVSAHSGDLAAEARDRPAAPSRPLRLAG